MPLINLYNPQNTKVRLLLDTTLIKEIKSLFLNIKNGDIDSYSLVIMSGLFGTNHLNSFSLPSFKVFEEKPSLYELLAKGITYSKYLTLSAEDKIIVREHLTSAWEFENPADKRTIYPKTMLSGCLEFFWSFLPATKYSLLLRYSKGVYNEYIKRHNITNMGVHIKKRNSIIYVAPSPDILNLLLKNINNTTPGFTGNPFDTPLWTFTDICNIFDSTSVSLTPLNLKINWLISSVLLIEEYNILIKAIRHIENINNSGYISLSGLKASTIWRYRQHLYYYPFEHQDIIDSYVIDINNDEVYYRELLEDFFYVCLNLLLAKTVIDYVNNEYIDTKVDLKIFTQDISALVEKHTNKYSEAYACLDKIREIRINSMDADSLAIHLNHSVRPLMDLKSKNLKKISEMVN